MATNSDTQAQPSWQKLALFILVSFLVFSFGGLFQPGDWYETINKAPWTPPNIAFPIVWTFLYVFIAVAGWLIFTKGSTTLKYLWVAQLLVNAAWSWVFFGKHWLVVGLIDIIIIDLLVLLIILRCTQQNLNTAAWCMVPYLIWLILATSLNTYIVIYN